MIWAWHRAQHSKGCANQQEICQGSTGAECPTPHKPQRGSLGPALAWPHIGGFTLRVLAGQGQGQQLQGHQSTAATPLLLSHSSQGSPPSPDTIAATLCPLLQAFLSPCSLHNTLPGLSYILHPLITAASFHPIPEHPRPSQLCPHPGTPHPPPPPAASHPLCFTPPTASGCSAS